MWLSIENIPYISLGWIGLGFIIMLIGVVLLARQQLSDEGYTQYDQDPKEIFSYFLEEEEKKNEAFRESLKETYDTVPRSTVNHTAPHPKQKDATVAQKETQVYDTIIAMHDAGMMPDAIAKKMNIGVGEVQLIISLYTMR